MEDGRWEFSGALPRGLRYVSYLEHHHPDDLRFSQPHLSKAFRHNGPSRDDWHQ